MVNMENITEAEGVTKYVKDATTPTIQTNM